MIQAVVKMHWARDKAVLWEIFSTAKKYLSKPTKTPKIDQPNQSTTLDRFNWDSKQHLVECESMSYTYSISSLGLWALISLLQQNWLDQPPAAAMQTY